MKTKEEVSPVETKSRRKSRSSGEHNVTSKPNKSDDLKQKSDATKSTLKVKLPADNVDISIINYEEEQAITRDSASDLQEFQETCQNIESLVTDINKIKADGTNGFENEELVDKRLDAMILTANLKKLNRYAQIRGKKKKENTIEVKNKVDGLHLDLQNLLYEVMHMKKEIKKCMNFSSKDEDIDLIDVETFYDEAPTDIAKPEITKDDPHHQMLARLDYELKKRKELSTQKNNLKDEKKKQVEEISQKTDYLTSLKPRLEEIIKATKPVQEYMNLPVCAERLLFETAQYLPRPLYVLYIQAKAFKDACDKNMTVTIGGDFDEAKADFYADDIESDIGSDSEVEKEENNERENQKREGGKRGNKKDKEKARLEDHKKRVLKRHPLSVIITLTSKDRYEMTLTFNYLPILHISTVEMKLKINDTVTVDRSSDLLNEHMILRDLLSTDDGKNSPNGANKYQLEKLAMSSFSSYVYTVGFPYYWVQWICGLNYLPNRDIKSYIPDSSVSVKHFQSVLKAIKSRVVARIDLQIQLQQLELLTIPSVKNSRLDLPCKVVCLLTSWKKMPYEQLQSQSPAQCQEFEDFGLLNEDCQIYRATLTREEALQVTIAVHTDYPKQPPLMMLSMSDSDSPLTTVASLRCLECEMNAYPEELLFQGECNYILSNMLKKLQICFDMFVETGPKHAAKDKLYKRRTRGRDRNRPYKYHNDGYFIHR